MERRDAHHDAIEFPNGDVVLLTNLRLKQKAKVLQLPVNPHLTRLEGRSESEFNVPVIDLERTRTEGSDRSEWFFVR
jgi:hypothetical protein